MLKMKTALLMSIALLTVACSSPTRDWSVGTDFDLSKAEQIEKGATTKEEVVMLFGEPYSKSVLSANSEKWMYVYQHGSVTTKYGSGYESSNNQKMLDVLFEDDVVVNFTSTDKPIETAVN